MDIYINTWWWSHTVPMIISWGMLMVSMVITMLYTADKHKSNNKKSNYNIQSFSSHILIYLIVTTKNIMPIIFISTKM